jgi:hypothetical protein
MRKEIEVYRWNYCRDDDCSGNVKSSHFLLRIKDGKVFYFLILANEIFIVSFMNRNVMLLYNITVTDLKLSLTASYIDDEGKGDMPCFITFYNDLLYACVRVNNNKHIASCIVKLIQSLKSNLNII